MKTDLARQLITLMHRTLLSCLRSCGRRSLLQYVVLWGWLKIAGHCGLHSAGWQHSCFYLHRCSQGLCGSFHLHWGVFDTHSTPNEVTLTLVLTLKLETVVWIISFDTLVHCKYLAFGLVEIWVDVMFSVSAVTLSIVDILSAHCWQDFEAT